MDRHEIYFREFVGWRKAKELMKSGGIKIDSAKQLAAESKVPIYIIEKILNNRGGTYNEKSWKSLTRLNKWLIENSNGAVCLRALGKYQKPEDRKEVEKEKLAEVIPPLPDTYGGERFNDFNEGALDAPTILRKQKKDASIEVALESLYDSLDSQSEGLGAEVRADAERLKGMLADLNGYEFGYLYALGVEKGLMRGRNEQLHLLTELWRKNG